MTAEIIYDAAAEKIIDMLGQTATYSGNGDSFKVVLEKETVPSPDAFEGSVWGTRLTIECLTADTGGEPSKGETFVIGANTYTIREIIENDGRFVKMAVK